MDDTAKYLKDLASADPAIRKKATHGLWRLWRRQSGEQAELRLREGVQLLQAKLLDEAEEFFLDLIEDYPDFPEGHNKLATVLFLKGKYLDSIEECRSSLRLNPNHFGAWSGLGMCLYNLGRYNEAIKPFQESLRIQPHAKVNLLFIARCRGKLN